MNATPKDKIDSSLDLLRTGCEAVQDIALHDLTVLFEEPDVEPSESRPEGLGSATTVRLPEIEG